MVALKILFSFSEVLLNDILILKVMSSRESLIQISNGHQMPLNNASYFLVINLAFPFFQHSGRVFIRWCLIDHFLSIRGKSDIDSLIRRPTPRISSRSMRTASAWGVLLWRHHFLVETIDFELSEEEYVFVVLGQHYFKQKRVKLFVLFFIILIFNVVVIDSLNGVEWNCTDWPCKVANAVIVVLVVSEWARWELNPSRNKVLFKSGLEFQHFSF